MSFKTYLAGNKSPISTGRFLNSDYQEMNFAAGLPDKGIYIEGVSSKISDNFLSLLKPLRIIAQAKLARSRKKLFTSLVKMSLIKLSL